MDFMDTMVFFFEMVIIIEYVMNHHHLATIQNPFVLTHRTSCTGLDNESIK